MQLPVDFDELFKAVADIDAAKATEISIAIYIDEFAPADLTAHVRGLFATASGTVRMTMTYLDSSFAPHAGDDMAVVVAGSSNVVGAAAAAIRAVGVPVAIVTTLPATVDRLASENGHPIPEGDVISCCEGNEIEEPFILGDEEERALDDRLGQWVAFVCPEKQLAFCVAFPFLRRPLAVESVRATSLQNGAIGLIPFIPGADFPILTLNQAKMALQIAAAYGQQLDKERLKELLGVIAGAYLSRALARQLVEFVPILGPLVRAGVAYGGTSAVGHAIIEYFEGGQDATGVANVATRAVSTVSKAVNAFRRDPDKVVSDVRAKVEGKVPVVRDTVAEAVPVVRDLAAEYGPKAKTFIEECAPVIKQAARELVSGEGDAAAGAHAAVAAE